MANALLLDGSELRGRALKVLPKRTNVPGLRVRIHTPETRDYDLCTDRPMHCTCCFWSSLGLLVSMKGPSCIEPRHIYL